MVFIVAGTILEGSRGGTLYINIGFLFCGIQPIVSTCMAMTKTDVRKYTTKLVTLSYIRTTGVSSEATRRVSENTIESV
jgi:hypothetical protein